MIDLSPEQRLLGVIRSAVGERIAYVCYSGGVDSTVVLAGCIRAGVRTVALLGVSDSLSAAERADAHRIALELGAQVEEVRTNEMESEAYRENSGDRCYHCKTALYETIQALAIERRASGVIMVGTQLDDLGEHRPGLRAATEHGVEAPLVAARLDKAAVRSLAKRWGLSNTEKAAAPCLASRVPVGSEVTPERLAQIETVEAFLRAHELWPARARWHGAIVRVEIPPELFQRAVEEPTRTELHRVCRKAGFTFVALDLAGLQSGSLSLPLLAS